MWLLCNPTQDTDLANTMSGHQKGAAYGAFTIGFPFEWTAPNGTKGSVHASFHTLITPIKIFPLKHTKLFFAKGAKIKNGHMDQQ